MNTRANLWMIVGGLLLLAVVVSGFVLIQPTAEEILTGTLEKTETLSRGYAVVEISMKTPDKSASATVEMWGQLDAEPPGAFRFKVLETSEEKAEDALAVFDGVNLWAYAPAENKVFVSTVEELKNWAAEKEFEGPGTWMEKKDFTHPETAAEAVGLLLEFFEAEKDGTDILVNENAHHLTLHPIAEQMPAEFVAVGGQVDLWIGKDSQVLLGAEYTGGTLGAIKVRVLEYDLDPNFEVDLFTFEVPAEAEVITLADLEPKALTLDEARETAAFPFLTPSETPAGSALVDILEVDSNIVLRYTLPDGGSFTVAQGVSDETPRPDTTATSIEVRGETGTYHISEDSNQIMLIWKENGVFYFIAGNLTIEHALVVAESLK